MSPGEGYFEIKTTNVNAKVMADLRRFRDESLMLRFVRKKVLEQNSLIDEEKKIRENEGIMNWAQILFLGLSTTDGLPLNIFF